MSFGKKVASRIAVLVACTILVGAAALFGLIGISTHYNIAQDQYDELRSLYEIGHSAESVRLLLATNAPDRRVINTLVTSAVFEAKKLHDMSANKRMGTDGEFDAKLRAIRAQLQQVAITVESRQDVGTQLAGINASLSHIADLAGTTKRGIIDNRQAAAARFRAVIAAIAGLLAVTVVVAVSIGIAQYTSVMRPIRSLNRGVARLASANFSCRIPVRGEREFRYLIGHFNRMSREIERLHMSMQQQVESKSRQLVRSEQLAGVGYLAAGLAHEINNPLGIIAGYAESMLNRMQLTDTSTDDATTCRQARGTLRIICEETFRCRDITTELLTMARPSDDQHAPVELARIVRRMVTLLSEMPMFRDRRITLRADREVDELVVLGNEAQLTQVVINLLTNALEATAPDGGEVTVALTRHADDVVLIVSDNGCGMTEQMLARAFDPFVTDKPRRGLSGSGLGLSVSHAVIERHGGRLHAASPGPGQGSTFTLELPAMTDTAVQLNA